MSKKIIILVAVCVVLFTVFILIKNSGYIKNIDKQIIDQNSLGKTDVEKWNIYKINNFSFRYPEKLELSKSQDGGGEIIAVENDKFGFQIFVLPFNEPGPITTERILKDLPNMKISNPAEADLGGAESLVLYGHIEGLGETFEVWVIYKDKLYQIMTSRVQEKALLEVLYTWKWE